MNHQLSISEPSASGKKGLVSCSTPVDWIYVVFTKLGSYILYIDIYIC